MNAPPGLHVVSSARALSRPTTQPVVILVHGAMDRSASFGRAVRLLDDLPVVRYDRRGYGHSMALGLGNLEVHVADLVALVADRPAVLVGHSIGGVIALMATQQRASVASVAAWEAPMPWAAWWPAFSAGGAAIASMSQEPTDGIAGSDMSDTEAGDAAERFMRRMIGADRWNRLGEGVRQARRNEGRALVADVGSLHRNAAPYDAASLVQPVLAGYGTESVPYHQRAARELASAVRDGELVVVDGASHGVHLSHPPGFASFVRQAVERAGDVVSGSAPSGER